MFPSPCTTRKPEHSHPPPSADRISSPRCGNRSGTMNTPQPRAASPTHDAAFVDGFDTDHGSIDTNTGTRYTCRVVIRNIRHRGLKRAHERGDFRKVHSTHQTRIATILSDLDVADRVSESLICPPTNSIHSGETSPGSGVFACRATGGSYSGFRTVTRTT